MRENSKDLAYDNLKDQLVVFKKAKGPSFVERTSPTFERVLSSPSHSDRD